MGKLVFTIKTHPLNLQNIISALDGKQFDELKLKTVNDCQEISLTINKLTEDEIRNMISFKCDGCDSVHYGKGFKSL